MVASAADNNNHVSREQVSEVTQPCLAARCMQISNFEDEFKVCQGMEMAMFSLQGYHGSSGIYVPILIHEKRV